MLKVVEALADCLWPRICEVGGCGEAVDRPRRQVCSGCLMRLPFVDQRGCCRTCGRAVSSFGGECVCDDCRTRRPSFDLAASALRFEGVARRMILDFKSHRHLWLRTDFTDWLEAVARTRFDISAVDAVLPIPLTSWHLLDRGYNPSAVLAAFLAGRLRRVCRSGCLVRIGHPARQAALDESARRTNVIGTFAVRRPALVRGRTLLLLDDIMTTGATLSEAAATLKRAGASRVWCLTLARSVRD